MLHNPAISLRFALTAGIDQVTGLGTPDFDKLMTALVGTSENVTVS